MYDGQDLVEIFSTFAQFSEGRFSRWTPDPSLRRTMERCLRQQPSLPTSPEVWANYWHRVWQVNPGGLARNHLYAYLEEACYNAANLEWQKFKFPEYTLEDYFQIARSKVDSVLAGFDPEYGSLKGYAVVVFRGTLKDELRQRDKSVGKTNWSLLRHTSTPQLSLSLENYRLSPATIDSYILAWECFKDVYVPTKPRGNRRLTAPDGNTWEAIGQFYNRERLSQLQPPGPECNAATLQEWMETCARAIRSYLAPPMTSLNAPAGREARAELQDVLPGGRTAESLLAQLINEEEKHRQKSRQEQVNSVLVAALDSHICQTRPETQRLLRQRMLQMHYGQGLTQEEIAKQLAISQSKVSRTLKLRELNKALLLALAQWGKEKLHKDLAPNVLKSMGTSIKAWLLQHYGNLDTPPETET